MLNDLLFGERQSRVPNRTEDASVPLIWAMLSEWGQWDTQDYWLI